jgi:hypothetical protein
MAFALFASACSAGGPSTPPPKHGADVSGNAIANLALANVGGTACGYNSLGGQSFDSSCTGNGGLPEYWCSDFASWVWGNSGVDTSALSAAAGSFGLYGTNNGTFVNSPQEVGDAVLFDYDGNGYADHVAIVTAIEDDGTIETVSGDWDGESGDEATFASTSSCERSSDRAGIARLTAGA